MALDTDQKPVVKEPPKPPAHCDTRLATEAGNAGRRGDSKAFARVATQEPRHIRRGLFGARRVVLLNWGSRPDSLREKNSNHSPETTHETSISAI